MGVSLRTNIIENVFLYFATSPEEKKLTFTKDEVVSVFKDRYNWNWDSALEIAFQLLARERVSRGQPGLLKLPKTELYTWQYGFDPQAGEVIPTSIFFTATTIRDDCELMRDAGFACNHERIFEDSRKAYEAMTGERFEAALERERIENEVRFRDVTRDSEEEIPF